MALTKRQKQVLDFIGDFIDRQGYSPSYEEIAEGLELASLATVHKHISTLEGKQYLRRGFNQSRSVELTPRYFEELRKDRAAEPPVASVPLAGRIAAGSPVEAVEGKDTLAFADFVGQEGTYALQVRGDSMIEDHICDGDYVLVERTSSARDGDIVVALVGGNETTLKRYYRDSADTVRLQPANSTMSPIIVPASELIIQGRLMAVLRKYA
jgi:repressor LexA